MVRTRSLVQHPIHYDDASHTYSIPSVFITRFRMAFYTQPELPMTPISTTKQSTGSAKFRPNTIGSSLRSIGIHISLVTQKTETLALIRKIAERLNRE